MRTTPPEHLPPIHSLGGLEAEGSDFRRVKPLLLLCFLALEGPKERRYLADFFWPEASHPPTSLSVALSQLRKGLPGTIQADRVRIQTPVKTDAQLLLAALEKRETKRVLELYRGPFLEGVHLPGWGVELEEWVYRTREFLAGQVRGVLLELGEQEAAAGRLPESARRAEAAFFLPGAADPEPDELRRAYALLKAGGSPQAAALRRAAEEIELSLEEDATPTWADQPGSTPGTALDIPPHNLPLPTSTLVGREQEKAAVSELLEQEDGRLITFTGPGGVGKTRLGLQLAREHLHSDRFPGGVYIIALEAVASSELVPATIAKVLGIELKEAGFPGLASALGERRLLLLLDNLEHLKDAAEGINTLLTTCPRLRLMVTSRERLDLGAEWVLPLEGLPYPETPPPLEEAREYEAVKLFVQRAKRARLTFRLTPENLPEVITICRLVGGLPLGLELAAAWIKAMTCEVIAAEIGRNLDFLAATARDAEAKHRNFRAVFEHSWSLLKPTEQAVLKRLAVFEGDFRKEAATTIADASIPVLASLIDKSLLKLEPGGRYRLHPLLAQHAREKLRENPEELSRVEAEHGHYYLSLLRSWKPFLEGDRQREALEVLGAALDNIRQAWRWAVNNHQEGLIRESIPTLRFLMDVKGHFQEGGELLASACSAARQGAFSPGTHARLLLAHASLRLRLGEFPEVLALAREGLEVMGGADRKLQVRAHELLGSASYSLGNLREGRHWIEQALGLADPGNEQSRARSISILAVIEQALGNYQRAEQLYQTVLKTYRQTGNSASAIHTLGNLGALLLNTGKLPEARVIFQEGVQEARKLGFTAGLPLLLHNLALTDYQQGRHQSAEVNAQEALELARSSGNRRGESGILATLAHFATGLGELGKAQALITESLRVAWKTRDLPSVMTAFLRLAELRVQQGQVARALPLLRAVREDGATLQWTRNAAEKLQNELEAQLPGGSENDRRGEAAHIEELIADALEPPEGPERPRS